MTKDIMEGSVAVAHTVARCRPEVIAAYPITPSTHVPEELSRIQPEYGYDFVPVESEFSAISAVIGASAAGARTFTATSSQGLLLMHEALSNASGTRLPIVMVVANRAVSAPLNIWSDWQDAMSQRDVGWLQFYCKNNQETVDAIPQAYAIAEKILLPAMVCFDGYYLTHEVSPIELPEQKKLDEFLKKQARKEVLDVKNPLTIGAFAPPDYYQEIRLKQHRDLLDSVKKIEDVAKKFEKAFGRKQFPLFEEYECEDADTVFLTMGSLAENTEVAVDELREKKESVGLLRLKCFRPFPTKQLAKALEDKKRVLVIEKSISPGNEGILTNELKAALWDQGVETKVSSLVTGLGGRDVSRKDAQEFYYSVKQ